MKPSPDHPNAQKGLIFSLFGNGQTQSKHRYRQIWFSHQFIIHTFFVWSVDGRAAPLTRYILQRGAVLSHVRCLCICNYRSTGLPPCANVRTTWCLKFLTPWRKLTTKVPGMSSRLTEQIREAKADG
jgi:hypothetical protein